MKRISDGVPQRNGKLAEKRICDILRHFGREVKRKGYYDTFDLLIDQRWRCEVKVAYPAKNVAHHNAVRWHVNFHRHGKLKEDCDLYIIRLEEVPGFTAAVHLVMPAPLGIMAKAFTLRTLIENGAPLVENFKRICSGEWQQS